MKNKLLFIYILSALTYFTQGIGSLVGQPLFYYLKDTLHLDVAYIMTVMSFTSIPWMVKPLWGFLGDNLPLYQYRRKSYIILSSILSLVVCLTLGLLSALPLFVMLSFMVFDSIGGAMKDVAVDGVMIEEGKKHKITGKIQSIQWGSLTVASILTGIGGGYIAEHFKYQTAYLLISIFPMLILLFALLYKEKKVKTIAKSSEIWSKYKELFKDKQFLIASSFLFCLWFSPSTGTPIMARMVDVLHMTKIQIGWLGTVGSIFGLLGTFVYYKMSKTLDFKRCLYMSTVISALSTFAYLYLTINTVWLYTVIFGMSGMFANLLMLDFSAKICKKGTEATTFALICSILNFGTFCSNLAGARLYDLLGYNGLTIVSGVFTIFCLGFIPYLKIEE